MILIQSLTKILILSVLAFSSTLDVFKQQRLIISAVATIDSRRYQNLKSIFETNSEYFKKCSRLILFAQNRWKKIDNSMSKFIVLKFNVEDKAYQISLPNHELSTNRSYRE
jgi:hypothetical protein